MQLGNGSMLGSPAIPTFTTNSGIWSVTEASQRLNLGPTSFFGAWPLLPDPNFANVTFLCHFDQDGPLAAGDPTAVSVGTGGGTVRIAGAGGSGGIQENITQQLIFSPRCLYVHGTGGAATSRATLGAQAAYAIGTADFTIECWMYPTLTNPAANFFDGRTTATSITPLIYHTNAGDIRFFVNGADAIAPGTNNLTVGSWQHIAVARSGTSTKLFHQGNQIGTTYTDTNSYITSAGGSFSYSFGNSNNTLPSAPMTGYMSEVRITQGYCRYTGNFTPPTTRFPDY